MSLFNNKKAKEVETEKEVTRHLTPIEMLCSLLSRYTLYVERIESFDLTPDKQDSEKFIIEEIIFPRIVSIKKATESFEDVFNMRSSSIVTDAVKEKNKRECALRLIENRRLISRALESKHQPNAIDVLDDFIAEAKLYLSDVQTRDYESSFNTNYREYLNQDVKEGAELREIVIPGLEQLLKDVTHLNNNSSNNDDIFLLK
jgi:hypothetical protein